MGALAVIRRGLTDYGEGLRLQRELWSLVRRDSSSAFLILLEHPPVFTLGRNGNDQNVLRADGIPVVRTDRGGDVTYHGPGQLVGYPIVDLRSLRLGVREFVFRVETGLIEALRDLGVPAERREGCVGVWSAGGKVASMGFRVERGVTRHGLALNVNNALEPFSRIHPCGVPACPMTSVTRELGRRVEVEEAAGRVAPALAEALGCSLRVPDSEAAGAR